MRRHVKVNQSTAAMFDDDEHVQDSKRAGHRDTEITRDEWPVHDCEGKLTIADPRAAVLARVEACTYPPCVVTLEGRVSTAIRSRCVLDPMLDSLAPSVGPAHGVLSESVAALTDTSTATTAGSQLDASQSAFQAGQSPMQIASRTRATESSM
jgi:hypothetical protein